MIRITLINDADYSSDTVVGQISNPDFPLPWGSATAVGQVINVTSSSNSNVGRWTITTDGEISINMISGTNKSGDTLSLTIMYAY